MNVGRQLIFKLIYIFLGFFGLVVLFVVAWNIYTYYFTVNDYSLIRTLNQGWEYKKAQNFRFEIKQPQTYDVIVLLRNTDKYPYRNLYLFVDVWAADKHIKHDTLQYMLADAQGKWLGTGIGSVKENRLMLFNRFNFKDPGVYRITLKQAMRRDTLRGITDVGLLLVK